MHRTRRRSESSHLTKGRIPIFASIVLWLLAFGWLGYLRRSYLAFASMRPVSETLPSHDPSESWLKLATWLLDISGGDSTTNPARVADFVGYLMLGGLFVSLGLLLFSVLLFLRSLRKRGVEKRSLFAVALGWLVSSATAIVLLVGVSLYGGELVGSLVPTVTCGFLAGAFGGFVTSALAKGTKFSHAFFLGCWLVLLSVSGLLFVAPRVSLVLLSLWALQTLITASGVLVGGWLEARRGASARA